MKKPKAVVRSKATVSFYQGDAYLAGVSFEGTVADCCTCIVLCAVEKAHPGQSVRLVSEGQFVLLDLPADKESVQEALDALEDKIDQVERKSRVA